MAQVTALDSRIVAGSRVRLAYAGVSGVVSRVIEREGALGGLVEVLRDGEASTSRRFRDAGFEAGTAVAFIGESCSHAVDSDCPHFS